MVLKHYKSIYITFIDSVVHFLAVLQDSGPLPLSLKRYGYAMSLLQYLSIFLVENLHHKRGRSEEYMSSEITLSEYTHNSYCTGSASQVLIVTFVDTQYGKANPSKVGSPTS